MKAGCVRSIDATMTVGTGGRGTLAMLSVSFACR